MKRTNVIMLLIALFVNNIYVYASDTTNTGNDNGTHTGSNGGTETGTGSTNGNNTNNGNSEED